MAREAQRGLEQPRPDLLAFPLHEAGSFAERLVWEAYRRVKANGGAAGVDAESIKEFDANVGDNLYRIWNRMSSGSYFPLPVRLHDIPKSVGRTRTLGIPTVLDRIAQTAAKLQLEPNVEPPKI